MKVIGEVETKMCLEFIYRRRREKRGRGGWWARRWV